MNEHPSEDDICCEHDTAMDVHCCNCHSGFIFDLDHKCPEDSLIFGNINAMPGEHVHRWRIGTLKEFPMGYVGCACGALRKWSPLDEVF